MTTSCGSWAARGSGLVLLLMALAACDGGSATNDADPGAPGSDPGAQAELPGDPGSPELPDIPGEASTDEAPGPGSDAVPDLAPDACQPACGGRQCGDDGCGGSCGTCPGLCGGAGPGPCNEGTCAMACCPNCTGRLCGDDGCAGLCGTCGPDEACNSLEGRCGPVCNWALDKPSSWGPAGELWEPACPADKAVSEGICFDYTGDGLGDNGMRPLCNQLVATLVPVEPAPLPIVAVLDGLTGVGDAPSFTLTFLPTGADPRSPPPEGDVLVRESGYDQGSCQPYYAIPGAALSGGHLTAGPADLDLRFDLQGLSLAVEVVQAQVFGQVQPGGGADGFDLTDGRVGGIVTKQAWVNVMSRMSAACDAAPADAKPSWCAQMATLISTMPLILDLHQVGDGTFVAKSADAPADAGSLCLTFRLAKVRIAGFAP